MRAKIVVLVSVLVATFGVPATAGAKGPATVKDYANIARDIVPSGNFGSIPTPSTEKQIASQAVMYNALTPLFDHVTSADINKDFKGEPINVKDAPGPISKETVPHPGITVYRDRYDIPYIYAKSDSDLTW